MAQFIQTPPRRLIGAVDVYPNLLVTTLAVAAVSLLPAGAGRATESAPQIKRTVQCELTLQPLTLGINPQPQVQRWDASAPPPKYRVAADQQPIPLTLGINPQPAVQRLDGSAPPPKGQVRIDQPLGSPLTLGINPQPQIQRLDAAAPPPKGQVRIDQPLGSPLTLGINPQPQVQQQDSITPAVRAAIRPDTFPNLSVTTLVPVAGTPLRTLDTSAYQGRYNLVADPALYPLTLGINPQPVVQRWDSAAPAPKGQVRIDEPLGSPLTLGLNPQPQVQRLDAAAPPPKSQVRIDQPLGSPLTLGINPQPGVLRLDASAPAPTAAVRIDVYPNLLTSTLAAPAQPLALPLGLPVDVAQFQAKFQIQSDAYPNVLVLGYPAPPPPPPPSVTGGSNEGGGGGGSTRFEFRRLKRPLPPETITVEDQTIKVSVGRNVEPMAKALVEGLSPVITPVDDDDDEEAIWLLLQ